MYCLASVHTVVSVYVCASIPECMCTCVRVCLRVCDGARMCARACICACVRAYLCCLFAVASAKIDGAVVTVPDLTIRCFSCLIF